jgi:RsiW-degrading membrane proteinase PrsW (M82 family)
MALGLLAWSLAGLWVWLNVIYFTARRERYAWACVLATILGGPAVWLVMTFATVHHVQNVISAPPEDSKPRPETQRRWFAPDRTSRN